MEGGHERVARRHRRCPRPCRRELIRLLAGHPAFELALRHLARARRAAAGRACRGRLRRRRALHLARLRGPAGPRRRRGGAGLPNGKAALHIVGQFDAAGADAVLGPVGRLSLRSVLVLRLAGTDPRALRGPAADQQSRLLCHRDAAGDRADARRARGPVQCFGVSGYSGAGTTPSDKNDVALLRDNLMPYALTGHVHEREVASQLGPDRVHAARRAAFPWPDHHRQPAPVDRLRSRRGAGALTTAATAASPLVRCRTRRRG